MVVAVMAKARSREGETMSMAYKPLFYGEIVAGFLLLKHFANSI